jgi:transcription-repair coupling factor (superfamily II helicase)
VSGRSKVRAYALLTLPAKKMLTKTADGASRCCSRSTRLAPVSSWPATISIFAAAATCLGEEQSGHIKEVGFELYQQMLEEAVLEMKGEAVDDHGQWSPQISGRHVGDDPGSYVGDLQLAPVALSPARRTGGNPRY